MDHLINVSKGHIPNLGTPSISPSCRKVCGGGWWVVETHFSVKLEPQAEQYDIVGRV